MIRRIAAVLLIAGCFPAHAADVIKSANSETLAAVLFRMPLPKEPGLLQRTNVLPCLLKGFQSNAVTRLLVVLPGVADELYLISRDQAPLNLSASTVGEALTALTNATPLRLTLEPPFLFLHAGPLERSAAVWRTGSNKLSAKAQTLLNAPRTGGPVLCIDLHWRTLQPELARQLQLQVQPLSDSEDAWHFERAHLAGTPQTSLEYLQAVALATGTQVQIRGSKVSLARPAAR